MTAGVETYHTGQLVSVLTPLPIDRAYDYRVPQDVALTDGDMVEVAVGPNRVIGVVWGPGAGDADPAKLKNVTRKLDLPPMGRGMRRFLQKAADYTLTPLGAMLRLATRAPDLGKPPKPKIVYRLGAGRPERATAARTRVLDALEAMGGAAMTAAEIAEAAGVNVLSGNNGDDVIYGGAGNDTFAGGNGSDTLIGGAGDDLYIIGDDIRSVGGASEETTSGVPEGAAGLSAEPLAAQSAIVDDDIFLEGDFLSLGISGAGTFGTANTAPAGFNTAPGETQIGMSIDQDGFGVGAAPTTGDFFLPGTPEESFTVGYQRAEFARNGLCRIGEEGGAVKHWRDPAGVVQADVIDAGRRVDQRKDAMGQATHVLWQKADLVGARRCFRQTLARVAVARN